MERLTNLAQTIGDVLVSSLLIAMGVVTATITIHDISHNVEGSKIVWVCSLNGNERCGQDEPEIMIYLHNLRNW